MPPTDLELVEAMGKIRMMSKQAKEARIQAIRHRIAKDRRERRTTDPFTIRELDRLERGVVWLPWDKFAVDEFGTMATRVRFVEKVSRTAIRVKSVEPAFPQVIILDKWMHPARIRKLRYNEEIRVNDVMWVSRLHDGDRVFEKVDMEDAVKLWYSQE